MYPGMLCSHKMVDHFRVFEMPTISQLVSYESSKEKDYDTIIIHTLTVFITTNLYLVT